MKVIPLLEQFISDWKGKKLDYDGVYGGQCFDLVQKWNRDYLMGPWIVGEYAYEIYDNAPSFYEVIPNTPTVVPMAGDIVVWNKSYNGYAGHTAVATGRGDINSFEAFSQNDPGQICIIRLYNYAHVVGWLRAKTAEFDTPAPINSDTTMNEQDKKDLESMRRLRSYKGTWYEAQDVIRDYEEQGRVIEARNQQLGEKDKVISTQSEQLLSVRANADSLSQQLEEMTEKYEKTEALRAKWYTSYQQALSSLDACKKDRADFQKKLTELKKMKPSNAKEKMMAIVDILFS